MPPVRFCTGLCSRCSLPPELACMDILTEKDINHSGDGGIYGQMLRNNGLQGSAPELTLAAWAGVGDGSIAVDLENPLTSAIPYTLRLDVSGNATGQVGFSNAGYWGIPVDGSTFQNYFWIKGEYSGNVTVRLVAQDGAEEYASSSFVVSSSADAFTYVTASFPTVKAPDKNVLYELTVDGTLAAGQSLYFGLLQLFPETYRARLLPLTLLLLIELMFFFRYNGLKPQLAGTLEAVKGSFLRFPGGNNL